MLATIRIDHITYTVDLSQPFDISIPLENSPNNPLAWYLEPPIISPVTIDDWVGKVSEGAAVNFNNIQFNPHAHGTHTESVGHISEAFHSVHNVLQRHFFIAEVISVTPEAVENDCIISAAQLKAKLNGKQPEAVVIRTLPNLEEKQTKKYDHTNWPYMQEAAASYLRELGVQHLLIDLPSVDKEKDDGALLVHKAFWNYPENTRHSATITEFIYVPDAIEDGSYLLNLQTANFVNDATPSRPVLYRFS